MAITISFFDENFFSQQVSLDGSQFIIDFTYNEVIDSYTIDIRTPTRDLIMGGIRLVKGVALLSGIPTVKDNLPKGQLVVVGPSENIGRNAFVNGGLNKLVYFTEAEVGAVQ